MNLKQKKKMQKLKPKASDGRKHLSDVRVIQRNLVYIIGLPLNLADEDVSYSMLLCILLLQDASQWSMADSICVCVFHLKSIILRILG